MQYTRWYQSAVFYEIFVRSFYDSNGDGWGDLAGITQKLDYLQWLGVDCIWLLPFFDSPLKDGGYDVADFYKIHPKYGTLEDFTYLVEAAHARGMKVIGDLVLNHTSDQHPWFQEARDPASPKHDWYVWSDTIEKYQEARIIFPDYEDSNWQWDEKAGKYYWHRFFRFQPDLNYDNPEVQEAMLAVARYWLELGLDGFRLDAVPYLVERDGTDCESLPETHEFLKRLHIAVEHAKPDAVLLAESNQKPEKLLAYFDDGDECTMAFHFPAMVEIFNTFRTQDTTSLVETLKETPHIPDECAWGLFLRNHDELTPKFLAHEDRVAFLDFYAADPRARIKAGLRRRLAPMLDFSPEKLKAAYMFILTLPGTPVIYYGDELGMGDDLSRDDRDPVRTPMPWSSREPNAGFSHASSAELPLPLADEEGGWRTVTVETERQNVGSLLNWIREALHMRADSCALQHGEHTVLDVGNGHLFVCVRSCPEQTVQIIINVSDTEQAVEELLTDVHNVLFGDSIDGKLVAYGFIVVKVS